MFLTPKRRITPMGRHESPQTKHVAVFLILVGVWMLWLPSAMHYPSSAAGTPHRVHVAFGFHVNLYHSFRGDTNDENGFGQDIRVIRYVIRELDQFNQKGIPVSAVWDFDSLFSLQELLPAHAPDIIADVQRRVRENGDDVILMSYNNGLVSAMNDEEFMASMQRAITNSGGSGVRDLFGRMAPVVRPQEMMTTPGNFERYQALGIPYVALYYSATPFDGFRMFSRELSPTEAHNPVQYRNPESGEAIVIIPTYHAGDLVEHVSLRNWAETLHQLQTEGKIDRDVLIFINFDADAEFWTGKELPWHLRWLPNTGGLDQLVASVSDLDFVSFSNVTDYAATHPPAGTIHFGQDTADGSFQGYHSWAEKAYTSDYWTRIVQNRRAHQLARHLFPDSKGAAMPAELGDLLDRSFETRLRALSTTNFGLATPFLTRQREMVMADLLQQLDGFTDQIRKRIAARADALIKTATPPRLPSNQGRLVETFWHLEPDAKGDRFLGFQLPAEASGSGRYFLADPGGHIIPADVVNKRRYPDSRRTSVMLRVSKHLAMQDGPYFLYFDAGHPPGPPTGDRTVFADTRVLRNESIAVHFDENGRITSVTRNGVAELDAGSLEPYIIYRGQRIAPVQLTITPEDTGEDGVATVRIHGIWDGPPGVTREPGRVDYRLRLMRGMPYLFIEGNVRYPDTYRRHVIQPEKPMLARKIDDGWEAVAPVELRFSARARKERPFFIHKRNYLGREDAYAVDYYRHSPKNLNVASINNHITAEYAAVTTAGRGLAVAVNPDVNANFAFCPFRMEYLPESDALAIRANPFGTYYGDQLTPPTRGTRLGYEAVLLSAPQIRSAGPTFNGYRERFELMVSFFDGDTIPDVEKQDLIAFANRPMPLSARSLEKQEPKAASAPLLPPDGFMALPFGNGILFHWETTGETGTEYRIRYKSVSGSEENEVTTSGSTAFVDAPRLSAPDDQFIATVEAIPPGGRPSTPSPEIRFRLTQEAHQALEIPNDFAAKILWANVSAWIRRNLL